MSKIVAELSLTKEDVVGLIWILHCWLLQYQGSESSELKVIAQGIKTALEEI